MRQLTLFEEKTVAWREVPEPSLKSAQSAIVRPVTVGVCDFDRALVVGRYKALPLPIGLGHEIVGEVVEVGSDVTAIKPGMHIILPLHVSCGTCRPCASGTTNSCTSRPPLSNYGLGARGGDWGGGMSDLLLVPFADAMAVPVPAGLDAVDCAAIGCNLVDLYRAIEPCLSMNALGNRLLLVGGQAHSMALYGIVIARALGVSEIDFVDDDRERLDAAGSLGARPIEISAHSARDLYQIVVDCSGDPARLAFGLSRAGPGGVCTTVWPYATPLELPIGQMFVRNVTLVTGQPHARALIGPVLELMQRTGVTSLSIPTEVLPWEQASEAFGLGQTKRIFVRES